MVNIFFSGTYFKQLWRFKKKKRTKCFSVCPKKGLTEEEKLPLIIKNLKLKGGTWKLQGEDIKMTGWGRKTSWGGERETRNKIKEEKAWKRMRI